MSTHSPYVGRPPIVPPAALSFHERCWMTSETARRSHPPVRSHPRIAGCPLLVLLFVGSGCAALVYEIVWFQLLSLIVGSSAISLGVLLATFMGGMCIGSLGLSRYVSSARHPLLVYARPRGRHRSSSASWCSGCCLSWGDSTRRIGGPGTMGIVVQGGVLRPLPPAADHPDGRDPSGDLSLGGDHPHRVCPGSASSTAGTPSAPCSGACSAGFYLLRVHDVAVATYAAVGLNAAGGDGRDTFWHGSWSTSGRHEFVDAAAGPVRMAPGAEPWCSSPSASRVPPRWAPRSSGPGSCR